MADEKVASIYAAALLDLAETAGQAPLVEAEIASVASLLSADPAVWKFFKSPVIDAGLKMSILGRAVKDQVSGLLFNFLGVLAGRRRVDELPDMARMYAHLLDLKSGRKRVRIIASVEPTADQLDRLKKALVTFLKSDVAVETKVDADLMGGMVIRSGDFLIDTSVKNHLKRIHRELVQKRILGRDYYEN